MKKNYLLLFLLSMFIFVSCSNDDNDDEVIIEEDSISVEINGSSANKTLNFSFLEGNTIFTIVAKSDVEWEIKKDAQTWYKLNKTTGKGGSEVTISAEDNISAQTRTATFTAGVKGKKDVITITVNQTGKQIIPIEITIAGTLKSLLAAADPKGIIDSVKVSGTLNYTDLHSLKDISSLTHVDFSQASIVKGERKDPNTDKTLESPANVIDAHAFYNNSYTKSIILPETITEIRDTAFASANIATIYIPKSAKKLGNAIFENSKQLEEVYILNSQPLDVQEDTFAGLPSSNTRTLYIPKGSKANYTGNSEWKAIIEKHFENVVEI